MKCLILAAGYATRLYPLTENFPKPLLEVQGKTILDWLIEDIEKSGLIGEYVVISNHKFAEHFEKWADGKDKITVVDDGTDSNETRLGAVKDIQYAIDKHNLDDEMLVIAGDNLLDFSLTTFIEYAKDKKASCIMRYFEPSEERLHKCGVVTIDDLDKILNETVGTKIVGIDNMNDYYDVSIKEYRLNEIEKIAAKKTENQWIFVKGNIADRTLIDEIFEKYEPSVVVNLAAQAGVRYSITNPDVYIESNIIGFYNILEACRHSYDDGKTGVEHLVYASSSSVYGTNKKIPYSTDDKVDNPVSLYAATKKSNVLMAHSYSKLYNIPSTGLRFFTVYGPAGRPDMAYFGFTNKLREGKTIQIFNFGNCKRDFTYVDDIVEGVMRVMQGAPEKNTGEDGLPLPPYAIYNIGNNQPENLLDFVEILQQELIRAGVLPEDYDFEANKELVAMQPGDVPITYADTTALERDFGFKPSTSLHDGLRMFAEWYKEFYMNK